MDLIKLLNQPFPSSEKASQEIKGSLFISCFVGLFLFIFRPFQFGQVGDLALRYAVYFAGI